jgi:hypothetical protein
MMAILQLMLLVMSLVYNYIMNFFNDFIQLNEYAIIILQL